MTPLRAALAGAQARLVAAGVDDPGGDARRLLAHAAGLAPDRLTLHLGDPLSARAAVAYDAALAARAARQPVSQIIGERLFWGRAFRVTPDVLDPRPETETLVAAALEEGFARLLDLGTGSGAILVTLLAECPQASGVGVEISPAALAVAQDNAARHGVAARAELRAGDWYAGLSGRFDLILSNPPYIPEAVWQTLDPEVRDWEPRGALTPGPDDLAAYRAIATGAGAHLAPGGRLMAEVGAGQGTEVVAIWQAAGLRDVITRADLDGRARVVIGRAP